MLQEIGYGFCSAKEWTLKAKLWTEKVLNKCWNKWVREWWMNDVNDEWMNEVSDMNECMNEWCEWMREWGMN